MDDPKHMMQQVKPTPSRQLSTPTRSTPKQEVLSDYDPYFPQARKPKSNDFYHPWPT